MQHQVRPCMHDWIRRPESDAPNTLLSDMGYFVKASRTATQTDTRLGAYFDSQNFALLSQVMAYLPSFGSASFCCTLLLYPTYTASTRVWCRLTSWNLFPNQMPSFALIEVIMGKGKALDRAPRGHMLKPALTFSHGPCLPRSAYSKSTLL